uniref:ANK_REP_REGION domain-containing protein n=1 Tax=Globodera pallida TaxID=36090 RepID=A0A183C8N2_GLOPA
MVGAIEGVCKELKELVAKGADVDCESNNGISPWLEACAKGHLHIVKFFTPPFYLAASKGHLEVCKVLFDKGAAVGSVNGFSPWLESCENGHLSIGGPRSLRRLGRTARRREDAAKKFHCAFSFIREGDAEGVRSLCDWFFIAFPRGKARPFGDVQVLIVNGADVNQKLADGESPWLDACENAHLHGNLTHLDKFCNLYLRLPKPQLGNYLSKDLAFDQ